MPWTLWRRVVIILIYYIGESNRHNKGYIYMPFMDIGGSDNVARVATCYPGLDWLAVVSVFLTMDLIMQQRVKPYTSANENNLESMATGMLMLACVVFSAFTSHTSATQFIIVICILAIICVFMIEWVRCSAAAAPIRRSARAEPFTTTPRSYRFVFSYYDNIIVPSPPCLLALA